MLGATAALVLVTASFPFYLYAAYIIILADPVTWGDLRRHVIYITIGLVLNTVPVVVWMVPRLFGQLGGISTVHAFLALQAYAFLIIAISGVWKIFRAKQKHDRYSNPVDDIELDELDPERMGAWRTRLRMGVIGWMVFWTLAYVTGVALYV